MNPPCARCGKTVYPVEKLSCLDQVWHKACFSCEVCKMTLNMKNYKGFEKKPYCGAHYPKLKATTVAQTIESQHLAQQTKNQSHVAYTAEYERLKGTYTEVAETPEMIAARANTSLRATYDQRSHEDAAPSYEGSHDAAPVGIIGGAPQAAAPAAYEAPAPVAAAGGARYKALFDYSASDSDEVSFSEGDIIVDGEIVAEGWMKGTVESTGQTGLLPSNYVEAI